MINSEIRRTAIVLAAGLGTRFGDPKNKAWLTIQGKEIVVWCLEQIHASQLYDRYLVSVREDDFEIAREVLNSKLGFDVEIVAGGATRHLSELKALTYLAGDITSGNCDYILIHDAARPLASPSLVTRVTLAAEQFGGAIPFLETSTIEQSTEYHHLVRVQTPQVFMAKPLYLSYLAATESGFEGTDTAMTVEQFNPALRIKAIPGSSLNFKITYAPDLRIAQYVINHYPDVLLDYSLEE